MDAQLAATQSAFRAVTAEEIAHYKKFGWVKLDGFIPQATCDALLAMAKDKMGKRGDRNLMACTPPARQWPGDGTAC